ncbi:MAG TPA: hypothetical protein VFB50_22465 [Chloroflexota bacterium]|nr:hypothetical protein [Chloroflexota bacterium]
MTDSTPGVFLLVFVVLVSGFVPAVLGIWVIGTVLGAFVGLFIDICGHEREHVS